MLFARCMLWLLGLFGASACAYGEMDQVLRSHLANHEHCPTVKVRPRRAAYLSVANMATEQAGQYIAEGCHIRRIYQCPPQRELVRYFNLGACKVLKREKPGPLATR